MTESQIEVSIKNLENWKESNKVTFSDSILALTQNKSYTTDVLNKVITIVTKTVKDISSNKQECHDGYMEEILKLKKTLKDKQQQMKKKEVFSAKKETKAVNAQKKQIVVPKGFASELIESRKKVAMFLYTCFMTNFTLKYDSKIVQAYILKLESLINEMFEDDAPKITKHLGKLKINLVSPKSNYAKGAMLAGAISIKQVAANKTAVFEDKSLEVQKMKLQSDVKQDKLEGLGEQCEKCHAMEAYCTMMQQIRASDEPMTRFMRCRACKETWTD